MASVKMKKSPQPINLGSSSSWNVESIHWGTSRLWKWSDKARQNWSPHGLPNLEEAEIEYYAMLVITTMVMVRLNWVQHVQNTTEYAHRLSPIQGILIEYHQRHVRTDRWKVNHAQFFFSKTGQSLFAFFFFLIPLWYLQNFFLLLLCPSMITFDFWTVFLMPWLFFTPVGLC